MKPQLPAITLVTPCRFDGSRPGPRTAARRSACAGRRNRARPRGRRRRSSRAASSPIVADRDDAPVADADVGRRAGAPVPSTTVPPRITVSSTVSGTRRRRSESINRTRSILSAERAPQALPTRASGRCGRFCLPGAGPSRRAACARRRLAARGPRPRAWLPWPPCAAALPACAERRPRRRDRVAPAPRARRRPRRRRSGRCTNRSSSSRSSRITAWHSASLRGVAGEHQR